MPQLLVARRDQLVVLTLNRPDAGNRLTTSLATEIADALEAARTDDSVRACVLTATGDSFCLGGDYQGAGPTTAGRLAYAQALLRMERAIERAQVAGGHRTGVVALGRDLYESLDRAERALLAALELADR